jgi:hypothetical protein
MRASSVVNCQSAVVWYLLRSASPGSDFSLKLLPVGNASAEALRRESGEFGFGLPRDEAYKEDVETAALSNRPPGIVYRNLRAATEFRVGFQLAVARRRQDAGERANARDPAGRSELPDRASRRDAVGGLSGAGRC